MTEKVSPLEQFLLLAKTAKGSAAVELIKQALDAPGLYVFGELLDMPNVQELSEGEHAQYYELLNLFCFGTYSDYKENKSKYPDLSSTQQAKLRYLTIVSLATKTKCIPYSVLLKELDIENLRKLEDLIIEVIYTDIIRGKLDQRKQHLEVDYAIGRDIKMEQIAEISEVLKDWCKACDAVLQGIETQITKANHSKEATLAVKAQTEQEVTNIKKTLKTTQQQDDEHMVTDSRDVGGLPEKVSRKPSKSKGLRGSTKPWK